MPSVLPSPGDRRARRLPRIALASSTALLALTGFAGPARAADATVHLTSVYASPIVANRAPTGPVNNRYLCTPEPDNTPMYGTVGDFNPNVDLDASGFENMPSVADQQQALQAGASNDLCFGFTLTPDAEPSLIPDYRTQNTPPVPDVPATHVLGTAPAGTSPGAPPLPAPATQGDDMDKVSVEMPAGFLGDPDGIPTCSAEAFGEGNYKDSTCPVSTQVGNAFVRLTALTSGTDSTGLLNHLALGGGANVTVNSLKSGGLVYNLAHGPNELARLGVTVAPVGGIAPAKFLITLSATADGRVKTVVSGAPRRLYPRTRTNPVPGGDVIQQFDADGQPLPDAVSQPMYVESLGIRAWGSKADHPTLAKDFAQWGTDCTTPLSAKVGITTYGGVQSEMSSTPFKLTGCDQLPFTPTVSVTTTERAPAVPTGATVAIDFGEAGKTNGALLKDASVTLPAGLEIGAQAGSREGGLKLCSEAQFAKDSAGANTCPAGSAAGDVEIVSPLQSRHFVGKVYLGAQAAVGDLPGLFLEVSPQGATAADAPRFKIVGSTSVDADGHLTTVFKDAPQLRFNSLALTFPGGPSALFSTPRGCGTTSGSSQFVSSASTTPVTVASSLTIDQGCDPVPFAPSFSMTTADPTVGARSQTTVAISRPDRSAWFKDINVSLPAGFLSDLTVATECPAAQAAAGACAESSRIATVTTTAGVGDQPIALTGQMYLAERGEGHVAGAVIVVHAQIGDLDLGNVVVPAQIDLRPTDAGLSLSTSTPLRFRGIALNLRSVVVALDRPNFPLNPTACGPLRATATITGDGGQAAAPTSDITYVGCAARGLQPSLTAALSGETGGNGHPAIAINIAMRPGDTNLRSTQVTLPAGLGADLDNVQSPCPIETFNAGACPASTRVGSVQANVSITTDTIAGDVYIVKVAGQALPGLGMNFTGRYAQRVLGVVKIASSGRLITSFDAIPDLPLTKLGLKVDGGAKSPIKVSPKPCAADTAWEAAFGGQGGQKATQNIAFPCDKVPAPSLKWSAKTGLRFTLSAPTGKTLKSAKITMPKGFKLKKSSKTVKKYVKVKASGGKVKKSKVSKTSLSITASGAGPKKLTITLRPGSYTVPKSALKAGKLKKGKKLVVKTRVVTSAGKVGSASKSLKVS